MCDQHGFADLADGIRLVRTLGRLLQNHLGKVLGGIPDREEGRPLLRFHAVVLEPDIEFRLINRQ